VGEFLSTFLGKAVTRAAGGTEVLLARLAGLAGRVIVYAEGEESVKP
jgi:hypothetical protein